MVFTNRSRLDSSGRSMSRSIDAGDCQIEIAVEPADQLDEPADQLNERLDQPDSAPPIQPFQHLSVSSGTNTSMNVSGTSSDVLTDSHIDLELAEAVDQIEGACLQVDIPDGRIKAEGSSHVSRSVLRVETFGDSNANFSIRLSTSHYAFSLKRSCAVRSLASFYTLANILK